MNAEAKLKVTLYLTVQCPDTTLEEALTHAETIAAADLVRLRKGVWEDDSYVQVEGVHRA